ncbi:hypothetical protein Tco_0422123 [Tanacetum coccineum]
MSKKKDLEVIKQNISHKPIDYEKLNRLSKDFGKRFTPQQELSAKQAFWLHMSNPTSKPSDASPVKIEAPKELPKVSLVNESLKKLKFYLARFDNVVKIRTTPDARTEGEWGFEHTKAIFNNEIIPFLKSIKYIFIVFDKDLLNEIMEVHTVFDQMDAAVQQSSVDKQCLEITKKELLLVFKEQFDSIKKTRVHTKEHRLKCFTSNCRSKPTCNKKNDRISQTPSRNMKNKVEAQPRKVNKKNHVVEPIHDVDVKLLLSKANSKLICATCKKSMFDGVHDMCLLDFVENVNSRAKSAKKHKKQNIWKPTGHVFIEVGLKWKPTVKTFTIDCSSKKAKIVESKNANHSEPNHTWGSNAIDIPSSSSLVMTGYPDCSLVSGIRMFVTYDRELLSAYELSVPLDGLHLDDKLHFVEEPLEIVGREVKRLKRSRIPLVKVRWNSKRGPEFTWEREDQFKKKYPHLFTKTAPSSSAAS